MDARRDGSRLSLYDNGRLIGTGEMADPKRFDDAHWQLPTLDSDYEHRTQPSLSLHRLLGQFGWWLCDVAIRVLGRKPER